jgi:hypothetical protein
VASLFYGTEGHRRLLPASGHAADGEHPLGFAIDVVPADGDWRRTMAAARCFG